MYVRFLLRRIELGLPESEYASLREAVCSGAVSDVSILLMVAHGSINKDIALEWAQQCYLEIGQAESAERISRIRKRGRKEKFPIAYTKRTGQSKKAVGILVTVKRWITRDNKKINQIY